MHRYICFLPNVEIAMHTIRCVLSLMLLNITLNYCSDSTPSCFALVQQKLLSIRQIRQRRLERLSSAQIIPIVPMQPTKSMPSTIVPLRMEKGTQTDNYDDLLAKKRDAIRAINSCFLCRNLLLGKTNSETTFREYFQHTLDAHKQTLADCELQLAAECKHCGTCIIGNSSMHVSELLAVHIDRNADCKKSFLNIRSAGLWDALNLFLHPKKSNKKNNA